MFFAEVVKTKVAKPDIRNSSGYSISASFRAIIFEYSPYAAITGRLEGSGEAISHFSLLHHEHRSKFNRYSSLSRCFWSSEDGR